MKLKKFLRFPNLFIYIYIELKQRIREGENAGEDGPALKWCCCTKGNGRLRVGSGDVLVSVCTWDPDTFYTDRILIRQWNCNLDTGTIPDTYRIKVRLLWYAKFIIIISQILRFHLHSYKVSYRLSCTTLFISWFWCDWIRFHIPIADPRSWRRKRCVSGFGTLRFPKLSIHLILGTGTFIPSTVPNR